MIALNVSPSTAYFETAVLPRVYLAEGPFALELCGSSETVDERIRRMILELERAVLEAGRPHAMLERGLASAPVPIVRPCSSTRTDASGGITRYFSQTPA